MALDTIKRTLLKPARYDGVEYEAGTKLTFDSSLKRFWIEAGIIADEAEDQAPAESAEETLASIEDRLEENKVENELVREAALADLAKPAKGDEAEEQAPAEDEADK